MTKPFDRNDPDWQEFEKDVRQRLWPKLNDSEMALMLIPRTAEQVDVKIAVELGLAILLDKPLIALVPAGATVPEHLVRCADRIVEFDLNNRADSQVRLEAAILDLEATGKIRKEEQS